MKIINFKPFRVILYYYYLLQGKGLLAENAAIRTLTVFLSMLLIGLLDVLFALLYNGLIGIILSVPLSIYIYLRILVRKIEDKGLMTKITKEKPKIMNSNILSVIFVILFTAFCFFAPVVFGNLAKEIEKMGIQLIK